MKVYCVIVNGDLMNVYRSGAEAEREADKWMDYYMDVHVHVEEKDVKD